MRENLIRLCCVFLGVFLTLSVMLIGERIKGNGDDTQAALEIEEIPIETEEVVLAEEVRLQSDYEAEAEAKLQLLKEEEESKKAEEEAAKATQEEELEVEPVSVNSIEAAPLKWKKEYPAINSDKPLAEKEQERSSYEETLAVNAFDKKVIENSTVDFSDIKIAILGDSLTAGSNLDEDERAEYSMPAQLQKILGCKEIYNLGIGGSTVSSCANSYPMVERWSDIPDDSDIIIVFGGTNDCLFENKWDYGILEYEHRMTEDTFCGDYDKLTSKIEYVYREHNDESYIKLLAINPPSTILNDAVYNIDPGNMVHQVSFAEAINEIAPAYSFEVIDFYNNNILNTHDKQVNEEFMPDGVHGNAEGYRIMAEHIASQIIQRIEQ